MPRCPTQLEKAPETTARDKEFRMATAATAPQDGLAATPESVVVRFAGDSGDGMQLTGGQFTLSTALAGNDLATFPDFPAEIRAPQGTLFGVSAFQINFGSREINTAGDAPDVLVAMNPAALKTNLAALKPGGLIIADTGAFTKRNLDKAHYDANPLEDGSLAKYDLLAFDISERTIEAVKPYRPRQQGCIAVEEHVDPWVGAVDVRPSARSDP